MLFGLLCVTLPRPAPSRSAQVVDELIDCDPAPVTKGFCFLARPARLRSVTFVLGPFECVDQDALGHALLTAVLWPAVLWPAVLWAAVLWAAVLFSRTAFVWNGVRA